MICSVVIPDARYSSTSPTVILVLTNRGLPLRTPGVLSMSDRSGMA